MFHTHQNHQNLYKIISWKIWNDLLRWFFLIEKWYGEIFYQERKQIHESKRDEKIYEIYWAWFYIITAAKLSIIHVFIFLWAIISREMAAILELLKKVRSLSKCNICVHYLSNQSLSCLVVGEILLRMRDWVENTPK